ncbi:MAG: ribosome recycling factor [Alphaproteobacteria bacterium]|nr:ribosome recycling factor [Alphaproteobacteria bacterium]OJV14059.1 MAG: ribosome recycling factor [Alphaproteobacteria bacterium 33-17]
MLDPSAIISDLKKRMEGANGTLSNNLKGLRTGRASTNLLDSVAVEAYGDRVNITQVASVSAPEPRMLVVQVWDKGLVKAVEKAIVIADLGLNPMSDGQLIRLPMPPLTEERRKELAKVAHKYGEEAKVAARNIRRDILDAFKKLEKDKVISEDQHKNYQKQVQDATDEFTKGVDSQVSTKEKEILAM